MSPTYTFDRTAVAAVSAPTLDVRQQAVVDHRSGPLLVLAGPGTGKTTTLVETVVDRIRHRGVAPDEILVLTFSRKAAAELRTRIGARLGRTTSAVSATTFHSFCYALVREFHDDEAFVAELSLLSAAEQDWRIQDVVTGSRELGSVDWPEALRPALRTRGFARELQALMARARTLGLEPEELTQIADQVGRPDWATAAEVFEQYLTTLDSLGEIDYAEVVYRALLLTRQHRPAIQDRFKLVIVDEYQDTDPLQVQLLQALAGDGRDLIVVGDPDQSIYAFRGAEVRGIYDFTEDFAVGGRPAPAIALNVTRRFGSVILDASRSIVANTGPVGRIDKTVFDEFRNPVSVGPPFGDGAVEVRTYASPGAEAEHIALALREAHLHGDHVPWAEMAVLSRSRAALPRLQRALVAAGIPVEIPRDDIPLSAEPAVRALVSAMRAVRLLHTGRGLGAEAAAELLTGPIGGLDASSLRKLARALRREHCVDGQPQPSPQLLADALGEPEMFSVDAKRHGQQAADAGQHARAVAEMLQRAVAAAEAQATPEQILWMAWTASDWPERLRRAAESGRAGVAGAHRDLDAICAMFDEAARVEERRHGNGIDVLIESLTAQEIRATALSATRWRDDAVRLMTAHSAKGLEWRLVVLAGVQQDTWPDVRFRGTLLQAERLVAGGVGDRPALTKLVAEERRLFYVAATRAQQRLLVTAVESPADDGEQPSRFLQDLREHLAAPTIRSQHRPLHSLSLRGSIASLRQLAQFGESDLVRTRAAQQLAKLAGHRAGAAAHPDRWWGLIEPTTNETPVRRADVALALSGSAVDGLVACPLKWFLSREARGEEGASTAQGFGLLLHRLAAEVVAVDSVDPAQLDRHLDRVWGQLNFAAAWISERERNAAREAIVRFAAWHNRADGRRPLAAEHGFEVTIPVGDDLVVLRGSMDRVEVDADGRVYVVDFKTGKRAVAGPQLQEHPQLAVYQVAARNGALSALVEGSAPESGGAELVQLRVAASTRTPHLPKVQPQPPPNPDEPFFGYQQLADSVRIVRREEFDATPGDVCTHCSFRSVCPAQPEGESILEGEPS